MRWEKKYIYISQYYPVFAGFFVHYSSLLPPPHPPEFYLSLVKVMIPMLLLLLLHIGIWTGILMLLNTLILGMKNMFKFAHAAFFESISIATKLLLIFWGNIPVWTIYVPSMLWLWCNSHISYLISLWGPKFEVLLPRSFCNG